MARPVEGKREFFTLAYGRMGSLPLGGEGIIWTALLKMVGERTVIAFPAEVPSVFMVLLLQTGATSAVAEALVRLKLFRESTLLFTA